MSQDSKDNKAWQALAVLRACAALGVSLAGVVPGVLVDLAVIAGQRGRRVLRDLREHLAGLAHRDHQARRDQQDRSPPSCLVQRATPRDPWS